MKLVRQLLTTLLISLLFAWLRFGETDGVNITEQYFSLPVLLLLPYPDSRPDSGWDRGLELLPAARLAVREINNNSNLLPGYQLQLIERRSDGCGIAQSLIGINSFADEVFHRGENSRNAIAILGLACSTVTSTISPIAGRDEVDLIQIAMANSHILRDNDQFPHLWRVISSVSVNINATLALMKEFNWTRVAQLYDGDGVFFQSSSTIFRETVLRNGFEIVLDQAIEEDEVFINAALDLIQSNAARIIFVSATVPESRMLICAAARRNLVWPGYVWIFHSRTIDELYDPENCDVDNLSQAIENVTLLDLTLDGREKSETLVSGKTYGEYREEYIKELNIVYKEYQAIFDFTYDNPFANPMYDEVWALALALNASLNDLKANSLTLEDYQYNNSEITIVIERHLKDVAFDGAVSKVRFNSLREASTPVSIFHVRDSKAVLIAEYDETEANSTLFLYNLSADHVPDDDFVIVYDFLGMEVIAVFIALSAVIFIFTTAMVILTLLLYNTPEVRATSPLLSMLVYFGCYLLIINVPLALIPHTFLIDHLVFSILCVLERMTVITGVNLVTITMLFRLIRIYKIFTGFAKVGHYWKDKYLAVYSLLLSIIPCLVPLIILSIVDPLVFTVDMKMDINSNPPSLILTPKCGSKNDVLLVGFWVITIPYVFCTVFLLLFFAFRTRKINYENFKDTKKIIIFAYFYSPIVIGSFLAWFFLGNQGMHNAVAILVAALSLTDVIAVQIVLFVPKIISGAYHKVTGRTHFTLVSSNLAQTENTQSILHV